MRYGFFVVASGLVALVFSACSDSTFNSDADGGSTDGDASIADASGSTDGPTGPDALAIGDASGGSDGSVGDSGVTMSDGGVSVTDAGSCMTASDCGKGSACLVVGCVTGHCSYAHSADNTTCGGGNCCSGGSCKSSACIY